MGMPQRMKEDKKMAGNRVYKKRKNWFTWVHMIKWKYMLKPLEDFKSLCVKIFFNTAKFT